MTTVEQSPQCKFLGHAYHDFAGAILWDMAGMILCALFVGIAKLIADRNPKSKTVSMVFGGRRNSKKCPPQAACN